MEKSDEEDTYTASCERVLFAERSEVLEMLHKLAAKESNVEDASAKRGTLLEKVASCLEKYLEQPHLLDPHLDAMMDIVMARAKELVLEREAEVFGHLAASAGGGDGRLCPRPGETFPFQVFISPQLHAMFCVVYQLCRVRGAKTVARLMPHEAAELEPVIHALQAQDTDDYSTWETRYGLLLWLSMLSLVPFDIDSMDSGFAGTCGDERVSGGGGTHTGSGGGDGGQGRRDHQPQHQQQRPTDLVGTILSLGMRHLGDAGPTRDAAAACLGSILTRPDMEARHLQQFLEWGASVVERVARDAKGEREGFGKSTFLVMGVMATLAALFKQGHREKLVGLIPGVFYPVIDLAELGSGQTLLRKMIVKVLQRIGMTYLPPRVVSWRYQRGQRSLLQNLGTSTPDAKTHSSRAEEASLTGGRGDEEDGDFELEFDVPAELEGIVEALLCGLRDRDTVVRWSAAKGVGRITGRLPRELADDVVCSVLDLFVEAEGDGSWHGGCLALAELARRGLLVPERLPRACPLVQRALSYDVRRGGGGVGSHVRDAACYVCWAFARAYSPQVLGPHLPGLCDSLLAVALLDREVNVRRAAAAAFQENVGRQGQYGDGDQGNGVAHGIAIITAADYFSLGNRQQAFLEISQAVARFPRYRHQLLDWLRLNRLRHWDPEIRRLSALALHNLAVLEPGYIADTVLPATLKESLSPDLVRRHGACLAAAEVTLALGKVPHPIPSETLEDLVEVVPALEKARLYRGRGGELMRQAACRVVEALALIKAELSVKAQVRMLDSIDESLRHPVEAVQLSAVAALKAVLRNWFPVGAGGPSDRLQTRVTKKYIAGLRTEDNAAAARGYALALGVLPRKIAGASRSVVEDVLGALRDAAVGRHSPAESCRPSPPGAESEGADGSQDGKEKFEFGTGPGGELDAETRRNAIRGLIQVCEELGVGADGGSGDRGDGGDADGMLGNANAEVRPGNNGEGGATSSCGGRGTSQGRPAHVSDINRNGEGGEGDDGEGRGSTRVEDEDPSPGATGTHQIDAEDPEAASVTREKEGVENGAGRAFRRGGMGGTAPRSSTRSWHPQGLTLEDVEGVFGTLLAATGDYSVDNRGDVGSWCRIEALGALERLARLAVKASKGFPMKDRGEDADLSSAELLRRPETDYARLAAAGSPVSASTTFGEATIVGSRAGGEVLEVRIFSAWTEHEMLVTQSFRRAELREDGEGGRAEGRRNRNFVVRPPVAGGWSFT